MNAISQDQLATCNTVSLPTDGVNLLPMFVCHDVLPPPAVIHPTQHGHVHTQLVLHSATLQGEGREGRWVGLSDSIDQVREWRDVCTVNSGLARLQELAIH